MGLRQHSKPAVADQAVTLTTRQHSFEPGDRRGRVSAVISVATLALMLGGAAVAWWLVGDLTESGVRDPNYMFRAPSWAAQHPRLIGIIGVACVVIGLIAVAWVVARRVRPDARVRAVLLEVLALSDGLVIGLVLRLLTVGAEGASFTGLTLFLGVPPLVLLSGVLLRAIHRFPRVDLVAG